MKRKALVAVLVVGRGGVVGLVVVAVGAVVQIPLVANHPHLQHHLRQTKVGIPVVDQKYLLPFEFGPMPCSTKLPKTANSGYTRQSNTATWILLLNY